MKKDELSEKIETYLDEHFYGEYVPYKKVREMARYFYELGATSKVKTNKPQTL